MEATESIIMCKSKDGHKRGHYNVQIKWHYDVEMKRDVGKGRAL